MKGDFSRNTFDPGKHYTGVTLQQGRVILDADWNEQLAIAQHLHRMAVADLIGPGGGGPRDGGGFEITVDGGDIKIGPGRFYVDGVLCENEAEVKINEQPQLHGMSLPTGTGHYAVYLEVFEQHVTAVEDLDLLEPALGGPDTCGRTQTVWQVKLLPLPARQSGRDPKAGDFAAPPAGPAPALAARSLRAPSENQLYRVEIHQGGKLGHATFKWSRSNAVLAAGVVVSDREIKITNQIHREQADGFAPGQWIEVTDEQRILNARPGVFARLSQVQGQVLTVEGWPGDKAPSLQRNPVIRRWESDADPEVVRPKANDGFLALEDGVEIRFGDDRDTVYQTGDHWLIPARAGSGVIWPEGAGGAPVAEKPHRGAHHYAVLAVLKYEGGAKWTYVEDGRGLYDGIVAHDRKLHDLDDKVTLLMTEPPLEIATLGSNTVLNDGETENRLTLRIRNRLAQELLVVGSETKLVLSFDVHPEHPWGLVTSDSTRNELAVVKVAAPSGWKAQMQLGVADLKSAAECWIGLGPDSPSKPPGSPGSPPAPKPPGDRWAAGGVLDLTVNLKSSAPSGTSLFRLSYENLKVAPKGHVLPYPDGEISTPIVKGPLVLRDHKEPEEGIEVGRSVAIWKKKKISFYDAVYDDESPSRDASRRGFLGPSRGDDLSLVSSTDKEWLRLGANSRVAFWTDGNATRNDEPQVTIDEAGKVGIGTGNATPAAELEVKGSIKSSGDLTTAGGIEATGKISSGGDIETKGKFIGDIDVAGAVPSGGIIMWSGAVRDIPDGWRLCDGSDGTPNLLDRFIVGAGDQNATGDQKAAYVPNLKGEPDRHKHKLKIEGKYQTDEQGVRWGWTSRG